MSIAGSHISRQILLLLHLGGKLFDSTELRNAKSIIERIDRDEYGLMSTFRIEAESVRAKLIERETSELLQRARRSFEQRRTLVDRGGDGAAMENVEERDRLEVNVGYYEAELNKVQSLVSFLDLLLGACQPHDQTSQMPHI